MRRNDELRDVEIQRGYLDSNPASVLYRCGRTIVLCTASIEATVPVSRQDPSSVSFGTPAISTLF